MSAEGFSVTSVAGLLEDMTALATLNSLSPNGLDQTVETTLTWLQKSTHAEAAELFLRDPFGKEMLLTGYVGPFRAAFLEKPRFSRGEGFPGLILSKQEPLVTNKLPSDSRYLRTRVKDRGFQSYVCVPLIGPQGVFGTINVASRRSDLDLDRVLRLLTWASRPIANAVLAAQVDAPRPNVSIDNEHSHNPEQAIDDLLRMELQRLRTAANASGGLLRLYDPDSKKVVRQVSTAAPGLRVCSVPGRPDHPGCPALSNSQSMTLSGSRARWPLACQQGRPAGSMIYCLPLVAAGSGIGVVQLIFDGSPPSPPTKYMSHLLHEAERSAWTIRRAWADFRSYERALFVVQRSAHMAKEGSSAKHPTVAKRGAAAAGPVLEMKCLGVFELRREGQVVTPEMFPRRDALAVLKILLMHSGRPVSFEQLIELLQGESDPESGRNRLQVLVHTLRRVLEPSHKGAPWLYIKNSGDSYLFDLEAPHRLDLEEFLDSIKVAQQLERNNDPEQAIAAYEVAMGLYAGDLFEEEPFASWCSEKRQALRERYVEVVGKLASLHYDQGRAERAIDLYATALRSDPLREDLQFGLIQALAQVERPTEALRHYRAYRELLKRELDTTPGPEVEKLVRRIRNPAR